MHHVRGLVVLVLRVVAGDELAADLLGPQLLRPARRVVGDDGVRGVEDPLGRPVVLLEHDHRRLGEHLLEPHDVAKVGPAELVDRLIRVSHHEHVAVLFGEHAHELPLRDVRVLELVDQHLVEAGRHRASTSGCSRNSRTVSTSRSSKSTADASSNRRWYSR